MPARCMHILCIHQNFPGQYRHLAPALLARGDTVTAIGGPTARALPGIPLHRYDPLPAGWRTDLSPVGGRPADEVPAGRGGGQRCWIP